MASWTWLSIAHALVPEIIITRNRYLKSVAGKEKTTMIVSER